MQHHQNRIQNFHNNFRSMHQGCPYDLNMRKDKETLLNKIDASIIVEFHEHPLFSCFTPERANSFKFWTCGHCGCNYKYNVPSFYCTACDYDLCQKCLMQCKLFEIDIYDYSRKEFNNININQSQLNTNAHNHKMALIQMENYNPDYNYVMHCKSCKCDINNKDKFYYCSLCNFFICPNCFVNPKNINSAYNPLNQVQNYDPYLYPGGNIPNNFQNFNNNINNLNNAIPKYNNFPYNINNNNINNNINNNQTYNNINNIKIIN